MAFKMKGAPYTGKKYNVKKSDINGKGVFASKDFIKGELVGLAVTDGGSTGTGNAVTRMEYAFKWANTTQITSVQLYNTGGNWTSGSKMLVYGNVDDATTYTYPNLPNGAIFEDTTDGNHYMWNGTDTWNEVT